MPNIRKPRKGSLQFWPRKRAKRHYGRVKSWASIKDAKPLGFAGYKVGMTHALINDNKKTTLTKGEDIFCPITVIECPPLKTASIRFYKKKLNGSCVVSEVLAPKLDKELGRKISLPKNIKKKIENIKDYDHIRLIVYTQPKLVGLKKKPDIFEIAVGGSKEEALKFAQEKLGKEISIEEVMSEGQQIDIHAITKGKGFQGPVKRFGIGLKARKSEKTRRNPGSLGGWCGQGHFMWRIAHAGQTGYQLRTEYNKWLIKIGDKPEDINMKGGFIKYGVVKNPYVLIKGSVSGASKRLIRFTYPIRQSNKIPKEAPTISYISLESNQGN